MHATVAVAEEYDSYGYFEDPPPPSYWQTGLYETQAYLSFLSDF